MLKINIHHLYKKMSYSFFFIILIFLTLDCVPYYKYHDQNKAAQIALNFSVNAFVKQDFEKAYLFLRSDTEKAFDVSKLQELVHSMHPTGEYPVEMKADDYEIVPNSGAIKIYLGGKIQSGEKYYYCIVIVPENGDYKVSEIYRRKENSPYPRTSLMKSLDKN